MIDLIVNIESHQVRDFVAKLPETLRGRAAAAVIAEAGADVTRAHLEALAVSRHRSSMPHNFYVRARDAVVSEVAAEGAEIKIPHVGLALRYFGGTVRPSGRVSLVTGRPIRRLAVPIPGKGAEGKTPAEFKGLFAIRSRKGNMLLAGRKPNGMVGLLFMLLDKTEHKPDPSVLPTDAEYIDASVAALDALIEETQGVS